MKKIIFLDIDGVLNSENDEKVILPFVKPSKTFQDIPRKKLIDNLNFIVIETGAKIVISSDWRKFAEWTIIARLLQSLGSIGEVIGSTEINSLQRGEQIIQWLNDENSGKHHKEFWNPFRKEIDGVSNFVILDDNKFDFLEHNELENNFVHVNHYCGLSGQDVIKVITILEKK